MTLNPHTIIIISAINVDYIKMECDHIWLRSIHFELWLTEYASICTDIC